MPRKYSQYRHAKRISKALRTGTSSFLVSGRDQFGHTVMTAMTAPQKPSTWMIEPKLWSRWDNTRARTEGWLLTVHGKIMACLITRRRDATVTGAVRFATDHEAEAFVCKRADEGSKFHVRALIARTRVQLC